MTSSRETLKKNTELAIKAPDNVPVPQHVWVPPSVRGKKARVVQGVAVSTAPPTIAENVVRITENCDPIGLLMAVANGQPIAVYGVSEDGEITVEYETLPLKERMQTVRFLADKVLPRMSITKTQGPQLDDPSWEATIDNAASRS